jgi:hypothetical protein
LRRDATVSIAGAGCTTTGALRSDALDVASSIGFVEVEHGQTGCKTPDAATYIRKLVQHGKRRTSRRRSKQK